VYVFPAVNAMTTSGPFAPLLDRAAPPFEDVHVALTPVIAAPLFAGLATVTRMRPAAVRATPGLTGGAGAPTITAAEATDATLAPLAFVAVTVHR
jgi:hypothetical protein